MVFSAYPHTTIVMDIFGFCTVILSWEIAITLRFIFSHARQSQELAWVGGSSESETEVSRAKANRLDGEI
jgi:hypothetical protein